MLKIYISLFLLSIKTCNVYTSVCEIAQTCVTDLLQSDCENGSVLVPNTTISNCCPGCQVDTGSVEGCRPPSNCLPDGRFAPVQCKGDTFTGRCFCSDEYGQRIFGQMWRSEASAMTCACSRNRHELETKHKKLTTLHCTANGDYEQLQCDQGMCWCAQPSTGQPITPPVQEADMRQLPCFSATAVGEQYLRRCESIVYAFTKISQEQSEHGTHFFGNPTTFCDFDGSYGSFQIRSGIAYCTDRTGDIMGSWQIQVSDMSGMNCNCARDTTVYFPARGMTVSEVCLANGNYQRTQTARNNTYCVDSDGYTIDCGT